jgi:Leucine-rich repeat (LRR) protein
MTVMTGSHPVNGSGREYTFLTLASLLVLVGVVGITLFLYIQNITTKTQKLTNNTNEPEKKSESIITPTPDFEKKPEQLLADHGVVCKRFTSLEEALADPEIACVIDLSGQKLTEVPQELFELKNITQLNLADNNLTKFPIELLQLKKLTSMNLANNKIVSFNPLSNGKNPSMQLQEINLIDNDLSLETQQKIKTFFGKNVSITY